MGHVYSKWWRALALVACALVLAACGDGVGRPIIDGESAGDPLDDAGLQGGGGEDTESGGADVAVDGGEEYCAAVEAWPDADAEIETQIVDVLNGVRFLGLSCAGTELGDSLPVLTHEEALRCAARVHTRDMIERDYFDHTSPEGDGPDDRIARAGYPLGVWGEVIGELDLNQGTSDFRSVLTTESEDCENLLDASFDAVGVGYYQGVWTIVLAGPLQLSP